MLAAIISLLLVILFVLLLHLYAKWFLAQAQAQANARRRRRRRRRAATVTVSDVLGPARFHHFHSFNIEDSPIFPSSSSSHHNTSKGLDSSIIARIPLFIYTTTNSEVLKGSEEVENSDELECVICLSSFEDGEMGRCVKKIGVGEVEVMKNIANLRVYYNSEVLPNTHEGVTFVCECPLSFAIPCTMSFVELQNGLYNNIQSHILKRSGSGAVGEEVNVDELGDIDWEEDNNDSEEEFEANYEVDDENDDGDLEGNPEVQNEANAIVRQHPFGVPSFMRTLDLKAMHDPKFPEYANTGEGNAAAEDGEFSVGIEFIGSKESVISAIKSYTISKGVDYTVYESEPQTFYAKCKGRNEMFEVREMQDGTIYTVNLAQRHCDCGHFQVYRGEFVPMGDPSTWDRYEGAKVIVNWTLRRATKGRPKSTRYLNEIHSREMRGPRRCTICGREGHSRNRCPQRAGPSSAGGH
ncbi:hypothetical protein Ahy_B01g051773 [Arachis hypogaea]|uniref:CCHC-type domain-containing protein n=1 Tax=Arachis hypogaea TaxID=3818 RepID=A0A445AMW1_ARAHY|nr:hypothetical protein Ahy_B01g051773 [Arachis hypogaea]